MVPVYPERVTLTIGPAVVRALIAAEMCALARPCTFPPEGGWRPQAIVNVARILCVTPYAVERVARVDEGPTRPAPDTLTFRRGF